MSFLNPTKKIVYHTSLPPQKIIQRIEGKISPAPQRKSLFDIVPLTYHGKIDKNTFELGRRSRGRKDNPPTAYGIVEQNPTNLSETKVTVEIIANPNFKKGAIFFMILIIIGSLPAIFSILNGYYEGIGFFIFIPFFFSFGFLANYLIFLNYNTKLAKEIQELIEGKISK